MNKHVDMQRIADLAGVSRSTVSRALADSPLVSQKTKDKIVEVASSAGYRPNVSARNFRLGRTGVIAVALTLEDESPQTVTDPFFMTMIGEIADHLRSLGYNTLLCNERLSSADRFIQSSAFAGSDGLIFIGQGQQHEALNKVAMTGKPMAVWGADLPDRHYVIVGSDNERGGFLAGKHLIEQGRTRLGFLGDTKYPEPAQRYQGVLKAISQSVSSDQVTLDVVPVSFNPVSQGDSFRQQLGHCDGLDGLICCSDLIAVSAISLLQQAGKRVPEDVAVIGYDNLFLADLTFPSLTSVDQDIRSGAEKLCDAVFTQLEGESACDWSAGTELRVRESA